MTKIKGDIMSNAATQNHILENGGKVAQYLSFTLDGEAFATGISRVREVLEHTSITPVPRTPLFMKGVINLRGNVVPIIDMRMLFGMDTGEITVDTCIIIVEVDIDGQRTMLGALTDSVQEVIDLGSEQMEPAPSLGTRVDNDFIKAMGKTDEGKFIMVLSMDEIFNHDLIRNLDSVSCNQEPITYN